MIERGIPANPEVLHVGAPVPPAWRVVQGVGDGSGVNRGMQESAANYIPEDREIVFQHQRRSSESLRRGCPSRIDAPWRFKRASRFRYPDRSLLGRLDELLVEGQHGLAVPGGAEMQRIGEIHAVL